MRFHQRIEERHQFFPLLGSWLEFILRRHFRHADRFSGKAHLLDGFQECLWAFHGLEIQFPLGLGIAVTFETMLFHESLGLSERYLIELLF